MNLTASSSELATAQQCETVFRALSKYRSEGTTVSILANETGIGRPVVLDALEQMRRRGAVDNDRTLKARWLVTRGAH